MLPLDIIYEIATQDFRTYSALVRALPPLARYCLEYPMVRHFKYIDECGRTWLDGKLHSS